MNSIISKKQLFFLWHIISLVIVYFILYKLHIVKNIPGNDNLVIYDAGWYKSIVDNGYFIKVNQQSNIAFFPLFPYLWKVLNLSPIGISILNFLAFLTGFYILIRSFNINKTDSLLLISTPSLFYCFIPYSEALFFLFTVIMFVGFIKKSMWLSITGLFLACLTRSVAIIFIPALVFMELMNCSMQKESVLRMLKNIGIYLFVVICSILITAYVQWLHTGEWFGFFGAQKYWGNTLKLPTLPFTTTSRGYILWLDGSALIVGMISFVLAVIFFFKWIITNFKYSVRKEIAFSLVYLSLVTFVVVFTRMLSSSGTTTIYSLQRYIFATSFFILFITNSNRIFKELKYGLFLIGSILIITLFLLGAYQIFNAKNISFIVNLVFLVVYVSFYVYVFSNYNKFRIIGRISLYLINTVIQVIMLSFYLNAQFLG